jgi:hypothetical protein
VIVPAHFRSPTYPRSSAPSPAVKDAQRPAPKGLTAGAGALLIWGGRRSLWMRSRRLLD